MNFWQDAMIGYYAFVVLVSLYVVKKEESGQDAFEFACGLIFVGVPPLVALLLSGFWRTP